MQITDDNLERGGTSKLIEIASALGEFGLGFVNEARFLFGMCYVIPHEVELCRVIHRANKSSRAFRAGVVSAYAGVAAIVPMIYS